MGRVEETNAALTELEKTMVKTLDDTTSKEIAVAVTITGMSSVNVEIAKSLAQLADDIHFLRETMAKELEGEKSKSSGPTCLDCKYSDTMRYVDKDGIVNRDVEWCERKHQKINFDDKPVCDYFKPVEAES